jgi:DNA-binding response OmpR family regulator
LNLPDGDGRELLSQFRAGGVPVIVLTARDGEEDEVKSFDLGCDDYVTKPFSTVLLRRRIAGKGNRNVYCHGELVYRFSEKELLRNGQSVKLTGTERRLLEVFLRHRNQVLTREALLEQVWDAYENYVDERTLKVNISRLREKVEKDARNPEYICTVFGIGYKWSDGYE